MVLDAEYLRFVGMGFCVDDPKWGIVLSDVVWLPPDQIAVELGSRPRYIDSRLVPFAKMPSGGSFSWIDATSGSRVVARCPRDSEDAQIYSPDFKSAVFRLILDELRYSTLGLIYGWDVARVRKTLRSYPEKLTEYLPERWIDILKDILSRRFIIAGDGLSFLSEIQLDKLIKEEVSFEGVGGAFRQYHFD